MSESKCTVEGVYKLTLPIKYFNDGLSEVDQKVFDSFKTALQEIGEGKRKSIALPAVRDDQGNRLFDLEYVGK